MADDEWIFVPHWRRFQHYTNRNPPWIKAYTRLVHDENYLRLGATSRALLHGIWALYALSECRLRTSTTRRALGLDTRLTHWQALVKAEFIQLHASEALALRARSQEAETEREAKRVRSVSEARNEQKRRSESNGRGKQAEPSTTARYDLIPINIKGKR